MSSSPTTVLPGVAGIDPQLIGAVEVVLEAVLGSATLTVADLTVLLPGALVELNAPLNAPVELRLNGIVVARGELVAVGDAFAVKVTEVGA